MMTDKDLSVTHRCSTTDPEVTQRPVDRFAAAAPLLPLLFEPHYGYGSNDPDGEPWPFGYLRSTSGRMALPVFELSPPPAYPPKELYALARLIVAAVNAHDELIAALRPFEAFAKTYSRPRISVSASDTIIVSSRDAQITLADLDRARALLDRISPTTERRPVSPVEANNTDATPKTVP